MENKLTNKKQDVDCGRTQHGIWWRSCNYLFIVEKM